MSGRNFERDTEEAKVNRDQFLDGPLTDPFERMLLQNNTSSNEPSLEVAPAKESNILTFGQEESKQLSPL